MEYILAHRISFHSLWVILRIHYQPNGKTSNNQHILTKNIYICIYIHKRKLYTNGRGKMSDKHVDKHLNNWV